MSTFFLKKIYELTYLANNIHYSAQTNGFVVESIIADSFSLLAAFYILLMIFIAVLLTKDKERKNYILVVNILFCLNVAVYYFLKTTQQF